MRTRVCILVFLLLSSFVFAQTFTIGSTCCNYNVVNKTFSVTTTPPSICSAQDSWKLDMDGDLSPDITVGSVKIEVCSSSGSANGCLYITTSNNVESSIISGTATTTKIIQDINYTSNYSSILNWDTLPFTKTFSVGGPSAGFEPVIYEYWYRPLIGITIISGQQTNPFYIALRKVLPSNDTIYGWIKMDTNLPGKVIDYAYTCGSYTGTPTASTITTLPKTLCKGDSVLLNATPSGGVFYGSGVSGNYFNSKNLAAGVYTVNYAIPNPNGCTTLPSLITLTVLPTTVSNIITSSALPSCPGQTVVLTASGALTYTWSGGVISPTLQISPNVATVYSVVALGLNSCSISTFTQSIIQPSITASAINPIVCPGGVTQLSAGSAISYTWSTGANTQTCLVAPMANTIYTVAATYSPGCVVTNTVMQNVATPTVNLAGPTSTVCAGKYITLLASGASTYTWSTGTSGNQLKELPLTTTNYSVIGFGVGGCSDTASIQVFVNNSNLILNAVSNQSIICPGDTAILTLTGSSNYIVDGSPSEYYSVNQPTVAVVPQTTTTYVIYGDTIINGCLSSGVFTQQVASCVGIKDLENLNSSVNIYPNPTSSTVWIELGFDLKSNLEMNLLTADGRKIKTITITNKKTEMDIRDLSNGIYLMQISIGERMVRKKILIYH